VIENKVIVLAGGAGLLGSSFAGYLYDAGAKVIILDNCKKDNLKEKKIPHHFFKSVDICSKENISNSIKEIDAIFGRIDALVNTAYPKNKNYGNHFFDVNINDFNENISMHIGGYFLTSQLFSKYFIKSGGGDIINIASVYGVIPPKFRIYEDTSLTTPVEYAIIKSGIIHFSKYLAKYLKGTGIRVNSISPGGILDNQPKQFIKNYNEESLSKGMLDKNDLNETLSFLLSDGSKFINGQNIVVDDGFSL
tara:strand:- start:150 stop:899 length:750 start_codon:yes stop_codon:yes gene_type:complete